MSYIEYRNGVEDDKLLFFKANRFYPDSKHLQYQKYLDRQKEIVSFDCGLFDMSGIFETELDIDDNELQILAIVINPIKEKNYLKDDRFEFCGYDICEVETNVSAITNCACEYDMAINYSKLNKYGLISDFDEAYDTINRLKKFYPNDDHAQCKIIKIWRFTILQNHILT